MGQRSVRDSLDLLHPPAGAGWPASGEIQTVDHVGVQVAGCSRSSDGLDEHATEPHAINPTGMDFETDDVPCELIHHDHYLVGLEHDGVTTEQIDAPETVLHLAEEGEPRWPIAVWPWAVVPGKDASHHILVNFYAEGLGDNERDPPAAEVWVSALELDDDVDQIVRRTFGTGLGFGARREQGMVGQRQLDLRAH